jgi:hypothetical protein
MMSLDDIDNLVLDLHDFLRYDLDLAINDTSHYASLGEFIRNNLNTFVSKERNHN